MHKAGKEIECNLVGIFVTMTADMSEEIGNGYSFSVCSLGLFGIAYSRDEPVPTAIELFYGDFPFTFAVENVYPLPSTGNALDVNLR